MLEKKSRKKKIYSKCPKCGKNKLAIFKIIKKNYPFGKKSKPLRVIKKRKIKCFACGYKKVYIIDNFKNKQTFNKDM